VPTLDCWFNCVLSGFNHLSVQKRSSRCRRTRSSTETPTTTTNWWGRRSLTASLPVANWLVRRFDLWPLCVSRSNRRSSSRLCCNLPEPRKKCSPWRRYGEFTLCKNKTLRSAGLGAGLRSLRASHDASVTVVSRRWCSTWVSTSSRSSCTTRSSSTSSTAPRMHWGACWASTASPWKSHGEERDARETGSYRVNGKQLILN